MEDESTTSELVWFKVAEVAAADPIKIEAVVDTTYANVLQAAKNYMTDILKPNDKKYSGNIKDELNHIKEYVTKVNDMKYNDRDLSSEERITVTKGLIHQYMFLLFTQFKLKDKAKDKLPLQYVNSVFNFTDETVALGKSIGSEFTAGMLFFHMLVDGTTVTVKGLSEELQKEDTGDRTILLLGALYNFHKFFEDKPDDEIAEEEEEGEEAGEEAGPLSHNDLPPITQNPPKGSQFNASFLAFSKDGKASMSGRRGGGVEVITGTYEYYQLLLEFVKSQGNSDSIFVYNLEFCDGDDEEEQGIVEAVAESLNPKRMKLQTIIKRMPSRKRKELTQKVHDAKVERDARDDGNTTERRAASAALRIKGIFDTDRDGKGTKEAIKMVNNTIKPSGVQLEGGGGEVTLSKFEMGFRNTFAELLCAEAKAVEVELNKLKSKRDKVVAEKQTGGAGVVATSQNLKEKSLEVRKDIREVTASLKSIYSILDRYKKVIKIDELKHEIEKKDLNKKAFGAEYLKLKEESPGILKEVKTTISTSEKLLSAMLTATVTLLESDGSDSAMIKKKDLIKRYIDGNFDSDKRSELNKYERTSGADNAMQHVEDELIDTGLLNVLKSLDADIQSLFKTALNTMAPIGEVAVKEFSAEMIHLQNTTAKGKQVQRPRVSEDGGGASRWEGGNDDVTYSSVKKKMDWLQTHIAVVFADSLDVIERSMNVRMDGTIVGDTSLLTTLFSKYIDEKDVKGELLAGKDLNNGLLANNLMPAKVLAIDSTDKFIFIAVTMFMRLISLYVTYNLITRGIIKKLGYALLAFIALYVMALFFMAVVVNLNEYNLRIMFNFMNFHINDRAFYTYIGIAIVFTFAIVTLMTFVNFPFTNMGTDYATPEERDKMMSRLEIVTSFIWVLLAIVIVLT